MFNYGPNASGGKKVSPPTIRITLINNITNNRLSVLKVPEETGVIFFLAILPAMAITGTIISKTTYDHPKCHHKVIKDIIGPESCQKRCHYSRLRN